MNLPTGYAFRLPSLGIRVGQPKCVRGPTATALGSHSYPSPGRASLQSPLVVRLSVAYPLKRVLLRQERTRRIAAPAVGRPCLLT